MTIIRERKSHYSGREDYRCGDPYFSERPDERVRDIYREYAGGGVISNKIDSIHLELIDKIWFPLHAIIIVIE